MRAWQWRRRARDLPFYALGIGVAILAAAAEARLSLTWPLAALYATVPLLGLAARRTFSGLVLGGIATGALWLVPAFDWGAAMSGATDATRFAALGLIWMAAAVVVYVRYRVVIGKTVTGFLEQDEIIEAIFNQTFQFVAALDRDGRIVKANQTLCDYAGVAPVNTRSMPVWELPIFREDSEARQRLRAAVGDAASGNFVRDEFAIYGVGENETVIDLSLKPTFDESSAVRHIIMEARDVTEAHVQHKMLLQAQKMEAVGELTAGIAHDFNNLLTVIVGNLELVERRLGNNSGARDRLHRAMTASMRGQALTQKLLAYSRRQSLNPADVDVNEMLRGMSELYALLGENISVELDLAEDLGSCRVDPAMLESAILNIAINARDAMPDGGTVLIQSKRVTQIPNVTAADAPGTVGDYNCLVIRDSGVGIPQEILPHVFEPFYTTKSEGHGSGLGLSMVYGFVRQSGGDVQIHSEVGNGTEIRIYLPAQPGETLLKPCTKQTTGEPAPGRSVLLVEDGGGDCDTALDSLRSLGCDVEVAGNGDEAEALFQSGNVYDLVVADVEGEDLYRRAEGLAAYASKSGAPIIFCSGFPRYAPQAGAPDFQGAMYLPKPYRHDELVGMVRRAFAEAARDMKPDRDRARAAGGVE